MLRRSVLANTALFAAALALADCAANVASFTPAQVIADAYGLVISLGSAVNGLVDTQALSADVAANIDRELQHAQALLTGISSSLAATASAPVVQEVEAAVASALQTLAAIPAIPPPYSTVIAAAGVVLPIIESWVASVIPGAPAPPPSAAPTAVAHGRRTLGIAVVS